MVYMYVYMKIHEPELITHPVVTAEGKLRPTIQQGWSSSSSSPLSADDSRIFMREVAKWRWQSGDEEGEIGGQGGSGLGSVGVQINTRIMCI